MKKRSLWVGGQRPESRRGEERALLDRVLAKRDLYVQVAHRRAGEVLLDRAKEVGSPSPNTT